MNKIDYEHAGKDQKFNERARANKYITSSLTLTSAAVMIAGGLGQIAKNSDMIYDLPDKLARFAQYNSLETLTYGFIGLGASFALYALRDRD